MFVGTSKTVKSSFYDIRIWTMIQLGLACVNPEFSLCFFKDFFLIVFYDPSRLSFGFCFRVVAYFRK